MTNDEKQAIQQAFQEGREIEWRPLETVPSWDWGNPFIRSWKTDFTFDFDKYEYRVKPE